MAKRVVAQVLAAEDPRRSRDGIKFRKLVLRPDTGKDVDMEGCAAHPEVAVLLRPGETGTFYLSRLWNQIYGLAPGQGPATFKSDQGRLWRAGFALALVLTGALTTVFVFGWFLALAGVAALFAGSDARHAESLFRRDQKQLRKT